SAVAGLSRAGDARGPVPLVGVAEGDAHRAGVPTVVDEQLELVVSPACGAYPVHVMLRHQQVTEHAVGVPLPHPGICGIRHRGVLDVAGDGQLTHGVERHGTEVDDAPPGCGNHVEAAEGDVPGAGVHGGVAPEV